MIGLAAGHRGAGHAPQPGLEITPARGVTDIPLVRSTRDGPLLSLDALAAGVGGSIERDDIYLSLQTAAGRFRFLPGTPLVWDGVQLLGPPRDVARSRRLADGPPRLRRRDPGIAHASGVELRRRDRGPQGRRWHGADCQPAVHHHHQQRTSQQVARRTPPGSSRDDRPGTRGYRSRGNRGHVLSARVGRRGRHAGRRSPGARRVWRNAASGSP